MSDDQGSIRFSDWRADTIRVISALEETKAEKRDRRLADAALLPPKPEDDDDEGDD